MTLNFILCQVSANPLVFARTPAVDLSIPANLSAILRREESKFLSRPKRMSCCLPKTPSEIPFFSCAVQSLIVPKLDGATLALYPSFKDFHKPPPPKTFLYAPTKLMPACIFLRFVTIAFVAALVCVVNAQVAVFTNPRGISTVVSTDAYLSQWAVMSFNASTPVASTP